MTIHDGHHGSFADAAAEESFSRRRFLAALAASAAGFAGFPAVAEARLAYGSRGRAVRALNAQLADLTYLPRARVSDRFTTSTFHAVVAFQKYAGLARDGIVGPRTQAALRRAEVPRPPTTRGGKRIDVSLDDQLAFLVEHGRVRRTVAVSTGRRGYATPRGRFAIYRRERRSWSVPYSVWLPWAAYFTGGVAFHAYPDVPPYPASHGCVRVPPPMAREVYEFAQLGTRVRVV